MNQTVPKKSGGRGCLIAILVSLALVIAVGVWIALSVKGWVAAGMRSVATAIVSESQLPLEQKNAITARIDQVAADWKAGKVTTEQLGHILEEITQGPVMALGMVGLADEMYITPAAIPDAEKDAGRRSLQRFARGVVEGKIPAAAAEELLNIVSYMPSPNNRQMKKTLTAAELQQLLTSAKAHADKADVPDEPYTVNYADEIDRAVQRGMEKPTTGK